MTAATIKTGSACYAPDADALQTLAQIDTIEVSERLLAQLGETLHLNAH